MDINIGKLTIQNRDKKKQILLLSCALFILSVSILFSYLYIIKYTPIVHGMILYWFFIIIIYFIFFIELQILNFNRFEEHILICQLMIFNLLLHAIYQLPFSIFYETDAHYDMNVTKMIITTGHIINNGLFANAALWPILHIYGAIASYLLRLDIFSIVHITPSLIGFAFPFLIYLFFKIYIKEEENSIKISVLSTLFVISIFDFIQFTASYVRETMAIPIIIVIMLLYYICLVKKRDKYIYTAMIISITIELVLTHHFSSFIFLILMSIILLYGIIKNEQHSATFLMITFVIIFAYWIYIAIQPIMTIAGFINNLINPFMENYSQLAQISANNIITIRGNIIYYGFFIFNIIFGVIMLIQYKKIKKIYEFTIYLFVCGLIGITGLYVVSTVIYPQRLLTFGWLLGALPLIVAINKFNKKYIPFMNLIVFMFFLYNIFVIPMETYTRPLDVIIQPTIEDYATASTINMATGSVLAYQNNRMAIIDTYERNIINTLVGDIGQITTAMKHMNNNDYDYIVVSQRIISAMHKDINKEKLYEYYLSYISNLDNNKVYDKVLDSTNIEIYAKESQSQ